jgi:hypothetical protein
MRTPLIPSLALASLLLFASSASAQERSTCARILQDMNDLKTTISSEANSYWSHRKTYTESVNASVNAKQKQNAEQAAELAKAKAGVLKAGMPIRLASLKDLLTAAEAQKCLSAEQLSAIREPAYQLARGVNFDRLPDEASEGTVRQTTPRMPSQAPPKYLSK